MTYNNNNNNNKLNKNERVKRNPALRTVGFNVSGALYILDAIDEAALKANKTRSEWLRDLVIKELGLTKI